MPTVVDLVRLTVIGNKSAHGHQGSTTEALIDILLTAGFSTVEVLTPEDVDLNSYYSRGERSVLFCRKLRSPPHYHLATFDVVSDDEQWLRDDWRMPASDRLKRDHPMFDEIMAAHDESLEDEQLGYTDPVSGYFAFNAKGLADRGYCCHRGCRHCPYDRS